jgi:hypothetical protein
MRKFLRAAVLGIFILAISGPVWADSPSKPTMVSFTMTPDTIDLATSNTSVTFTLKVSSPNGISSLQTLVTLTDGGANTIVARLVRTDVPANFGLQTVTFLGSTEIPQALQSGVYTATAAPIVGLNPDGTVGLATDKLYATTTSNLVGGANSLLVRKGGSLNYSFATFTGPAFNKSLGVSYLDPKFNSVTSPIWRVGESVDLSNYYELKVPSLKLITKSMSPSVCTSEGKILQLIATGPCNFTVYTNQTSDYQLYKDDENINISAARTKPVYTPGTIPTQSSISLPLSIPGPVIYGPLGLVVPATSTPSICYPTGTYITVVSGGTCALVYSTSASESYLASDRYSLVFEITRTAQTLTFTLPTSAPLTSKSIPLNANSSSGNPVTFKSNSPAICSVTENLLNLKAPGDCQVEALQIGTTTIAPASIIHSISLTAGSSLNSKKSPLSKILCVKNRKVLKFNGPKCPIGYKNGM